MQAIKTPIHREARFWDRIAERYAAKPVPDQEVYETKLAKTDSYLRSHNTVLEIGCGTGSTALHHATRVQHIRALDISTKMIEIARNKAERAGVDNIDFEIASVDAPGHEGVTYDVIIAHSILHLLSDVDQALSQLSALLKPGGLLISTTACIKDFMPVFKLLAPLGRWARLMPYVNVFGETDLIRWHQDAGFQIEHRWLPAPKRGVYLVARSGAHG
ncbi:MAG: class I SAM-dependent methyltransferase [Pseudomonadota bacterium]